jgi:hypothetical protein
VRITKKMHKAGVKRLNELFRWTPASATNPRGGGKSGRARRRRKIAHESRRRNR